MSLKCVKVSCLLLHLFTLATHYSLVRLTKLKCSADAMLQLSKSGDKTVKLLHTIHDRWDVTPYSLQDDRRGSSETLVNFCQITRRHNIKAAIFIVTTLRTSYIPMCSYFSTTLTEVFPCFFLSCKANARV
jgi:hypothetical protein